MPRPLAVGLVEHHTGASEVARSRARTVLSLMGGREGYCLVEVFELEGVPGLDRAALAGLREVIERREITTAFVAGLTTLPDCLADLTLIIVSVPGTGPIDSRGLSCPRTRQPARRHPNEGNSTADGLGGGGS